MLQYAVLSALSAASSATNLFVSSYAGDVTTLSLAEVNGSYSLNATSANPNWVLILRGSLLMPLEELSTV